MKRIFAVVLALCCFVGLGAVVIDGDKIQIGGDGGASLTLRGDPEPSAELFGGENRSIVLLTEGSIVIRTTSGNGLKDLIRVDETNGVRLPNCPTSDPHIANALYNDNGTLKISAGP